MSGEGKGFLVWTAFDEVGGNPVIPVIVIKIIENDFAMVVNTPIRSLLEGLVERLSRYSVKLKINVLVASSGFGQRGEIHAQHLGECVAVNDDAVIGAIVPEYDFKSLP